MAGYLLREAAPTKDASLEHILVRESSERCGFFRALEMYSGDRPNWEWLLWSVFFASFGVIERLGASGRFLVILRDRREDFLSLTAGLESYGL